MVSKAMSPSDKQDGRECQATATSSENFLKSQCIGTDKHCMIASFQNQLASC